MLNKKKESFFKKKMVDETKVLKIALICLGCVLVAGLLVTITSKPTSKAPRVKPVSGPNARPWCTQTSYAIEYKRKGKVVRTPWSRFITSATPAVIEVMLPKNGGPFDVVRRQTSSGSGNVVRVAVGLRGGKFVDVGNPCPQDDVPTDPDPSQYTPVMVESIPGRNVFIDQTTNTSWLSNDVPWPAVTRYRNGTGVSKPWMSATKGTPVLRVPKASGVIERNVNFSLFDDQTGEGVPLVCILDGLNQICLAAGREVFFSFGGTLIGYECGTEEDLEFLNELILDPELSAGMSEIGFTQTVDTLQGTAHSFPRFYWEPTDIEVVGGIFKDENPPEPMSCEM